jgi:hypothetical protein
MRSHRSLAFGLLFAFTAVLACTVPTTGSVPAAPLASRDVPVAQPAKPAVQAPAAVLEVRGGPPGGQASATVRTSPGARCAPAYVTPRGTRSTAKGLVERTADANGVAAWTWVIGSSTVPGTGNVTVTCDGVRVGHPIRIG